MAAARVAGAAAARGAGGERGSGSGGGGMGVSLCAASGFTGSADSMKPPVDQGQSQREAQVRNGSARAEAQHTSLIWNRMQHVPGRTTPCRPLSPLQLGQRCGTFCSRLEANMACGRCRSFTCIGNSRGPFGLSRKQLAVGKWLAADVGICGRHGGALEAGRPPSKASYAQLPTR